MKAFVIALASFTLTVDTILFTLFVSKYSLALVPLIFIFLVLFKKSLPKAEQKIENGLKMGRGMDLENPDTPKAVNVVLEDKALNLGFLAVGGPGSGKTIAGIVFLEYYTKVRNQGWVYWDGKGDLDIYQSCMGCGAQPDYFFSTELPHSDTVNVLAGPLENVIDRLTKVLIQSESEYYRNAQRAALRSVVPLLIKLDMPVVLRDLYVLMKDDNATRYVIKMAKEKGVSADVIKIAEDFFSIDEDTRKNDIKGLLTRMQLFVFGDINDRINAYEPTLDLTVACRENKRVYMHMPYSTMAKDFSIFLTEQIGVIASNRQLYEKNRTAWPQAFDDWGAFFYSESGSITARCRSAKMPVSYLFQSKGQTDRVESGGNFTKEVTDNIGGFFALRINGQDTANWAAQQFGVYESNELNVTDNDRFSGHGLSARTKPRLNGQALKNLDAGEAYISCLVSGDKGASENKIYKARFPLPDFKDADSFDWPIIHSVKPSTNGLNLWRDFMDNDKAETLKKEIREQALEDMKMKQEETTTKEADFL